MIRLNESDIQPANNDSQERLDPIPETGAMHRGSNDQATWSTVSHSRQILKTKNPGKSISKRAECNTQSVGKGGGMEQAKRPNAIHASQKFYELPWKQITPTIAKMLFILCLGDHRMVLVLLTLILDFTSWNLNSSRIPRSFADYWPLRIPCETPRGRALKLIGTVVKSQRNSFSKTRHSTYFKPKNSKNENTTLRTSAGPSTPDLSNSRPECTEEVHSAIQLPRNVRHSQVVDQLGALADEYAKYPWFDPMIRCIVYAVLGDVDLSDTKVKSASKEEKVRSVEKIPQLLDAINFKQESLITGEIETVEICTVCKKEQAKSHKPFSVFQVTLLCGQPALKGLIEGEFARRDVTRTCKVPPCMGGCAEVTISVSKYPHILIVHLDRYDKTKIWNVDVSFDLSLEFNKQSYDLTAALVVDDAFVPFVNRSGTWYKPSPNGRGDEQCNFKESNWYMLFYALKPKEKYEKGENEKG